jgi:hypothetical protein
MIAAIEAAKMNPKTSAKRWLRKAHLRERYAGISNKGIERAVAAGRLPPPQFPLGTRVPYWDEDELAENERKAALARREPATVGRPYQRKSEDAAA